MATYYVEVTLGGKQCLLPDRADFDIDANCFECPAGQEFGMGTFLMRPADVPTSAEGPVVATFRETNTESREAREVSIGSLYVLRTEPAERANSGGAVKVTVVDVRYLWAKSSTVDASYNVLDRISAVAYLPETTVGSQGDNHAFTWQQMLDDLWGRLVDAPDSPQLGFAAPSQPYNWSLQGVNAWEAYNAVCERLLVIPVFDPVDGSFRLERLGAADTTGDAVFGSASSAGCIEREDACAYEQRTIGPDQLLVHFARYDYESGTENDAGESGTWATKPYHVKTESSIGGRGDLAIHADTPAFMPYETDTPNNNSELTTIAADLASTVANDMATPASSYMLRGPWAIRTGGQVKSVRWEQRFDRSVNDVHDERGGMRTFAIVQPGYPHAKGRERKLSYAPAFERLRYGNFNRFQAPNAYPQKMQIVITGGNADSTFPELSAPDPDTPTSPIYHGKVHRIDPGPYTSGGQPVSYEPIGDCYIAFINWWHGIDLPVYFGQHSTLRYWETHREGDRFLGRLNGYRDGAGGVRPLYLVRGHRPEDKFTVQLLNPLSAANGATMSGPTQAMLLRHRSDGSLAATGMVLSSIYNSLECSLGALDVCEVRYVPEAVPALTYEGQVGHFVVIDRCGGMGPSTPVRAAELTEDVDAGSIASPSGPYTAYLLLCSSSGGVPAWSRQTSGGGYTEIAIYNIIDRAYGEAGDAVHVYEDPACSDVWHIIEAKSNAAAAIPQIALAFADTDTDAGEDTTGVLFWWNTADCDDVSAGDNIIICNKLNYPIPYGEVIVARCLDENGAGIDDESGTQLWQIVTASWKRVTRFVCEVACADGCELIVRTRADWINYYDQELCGLDYAPEDAIVLEEVPSEELFDVFIGFDSETFL